MSQEANSPSTRVHRFDPLLASFAVVLSIIPCIPHYLTTYYQSTFGRDTALRFIEACIDSHICLIGLPVPFVAIRVLGRTKITNRTGDILSVAFSVLSLALFGFSMGNPGVRLTYEDIFPSQTPSAYVGLPPSSRALDGVYSKLCKAAKEDPQQLLPPLEVPGMRTNPNTPPNSSLSSTGWPLRTDFDGQTYYYLGHMIGNDGAMGALAEAYRKAIQDGKPLAHADTSGEAPIARLSLAAPFSKVRPDLPLPGIGLTAVPLLFEKMSGVKSGSGLVLFADGHYEYRAYPGQWPMTETTMRLLRACFESLCLCSSRQSLAHQVYHSAPDHGLAVVRALLVVF